ncbi:hypothetical protein [Methylohalobius crimeensis]|uniref:hypothetical protein n=1 Tax=Methylohalobius crimeensis TaxID=244365 RepID=UPI0003B61DDE|nr:hypothetical protein [Methylohalobius crimeensis]
MSAQTHSYSTDPDRLQSWLAELSWLDEDQTAAKLLPPLQALARAPIPPRQRYRLLELYQPRLFSLTEALENRLLDAALPLQDRDRETARQLLALCRQMIANAIQVTLEPEFFHPRSWGPSERVALLNHTLDWLARMARHSAQVYHSLDENYWRTVYRLYLLLEAQGMLAGISHPKNQAATPEPDPDIRTHLFRILLFGLCTPQQFRPEELKQIDGFLRRFAGYAEIHYLSRRQPLKAAFFFDGARPQAPCSIKRFKQIEPPPEIPRFIHTRPVTQKLLAYVASSHSLGDEILPLSRAKKLALRLAHILGAPAQRKWRRIPEQKDCFLIAGLSELIAALAREDSTGRSLSHLLPPTPERDAKTEYNIDFELIPLDDAPEYEYQAQRSEANIFQQLLDNHNQLDPQEIWPRKPSPPSSSQRIRFPGRFANVCAQGYCLIWLDHSCAKLKVGELLGINHTQDEIEVGAIRWLRQESERQVTVGVELLSFTARLVVVGKELPDADALQPQREWGLFFPAQPATRCPPSLLAPASVWQRGQWVEIYRNRKEKERFCLKQRSDATPAYDLFELEPIN